MPLSADAASQKISEHLRSLRLAVCEIEEERRRNEFWIDSVLKSEREGTKKTTVLRSALAAAEAEENLLRDALAHIHQIRQLKNERRVQARQEGIKETIGCGALMKLLLSTAATVPLHVSRIGEKAPPLCGAIPAEAGYIAKAGDSVAALVHVSDNEENWILAEVIGFNPINNKYEVDDVDEEQKTRHVLSRNSVVPLPLMRANPQTDVDALFPVGSEVMALYPQTTCFYKAVVSGLPSTAVDGYEILFEDSSYDEGYSPPEQVAQRYVIAIKEVKTVNV